MLIIVLKIRGVRGIIGGEIGVRGKERGNKGERGEFLRPIDIKNVLWYTVGVMLATVQFESYSLSNYFFEFLGQIENEITKMSALSVIAFGGYIPVDSVFKISQHFQPDDTFLSENHPAILAQTSAFLDNSLCANDGNRPYVASQAVLNSLLDSIGFTTYLENKVEMGVSDAAIDPLYEWFGDLIYSEAVTDSNGKSVLNWVEDLGFIRYAADVPFLVGRSCQPVVIDGSESDNVILIMPVCNPVEEEKYNPISSLGGGAAFTLPGVFKKTNNYAFDHMDAPSDDTVLFIVDGFPCAAEELYYNGIPLVLPDEV